MIWTSAGHRVRSAGRAFVVGPGWGSRTAARVRVDAEAAAKLEGAVGVDDLKVEVEFAAKLEHGEDLGREVGHVVHQWYATSTTTVARFSPMAMTPFTQTSASGGSCRLHA